MNHRIYSYHILILVLRGSDTYNKVYQIIIIFYFSGICLILIFFFSWALVSLLYLSSKIGDHRDPICFISIDLRAIFRKHFFLNTSRCSICAIFLDLHKELSLVLRLWRLHCCCFVRFILVCRQEASSSLSSRCRLKLFHCIIWCSFYDLDQI